MSDDLVELGVIGKPHGVRGAMRLHLHNSDSDLVHALDELLVHSPGGDTEAWWQVKRLGTAGKGSLALTVAEVTDRNAAAAHRGWRIMFPKAALPPLEADEFYYHELPGFAVETPSGRRIGRVQQVTDTQLDVLEVAGDDGREWLIPVVSDFVVRIDRDARCVVVVENLEELFEDAH